MHLCWPVTQTTQHIKPEHLVWMHEVKFTIDQSVVPSEVEAVLLCEVNVGNPWRAWFRASSKLCAKRCSWDSETQHKTNVSTNTQMTCQWRVNVMFRPVVCETGSCVTASESTALEEKLIHSYFLLSVALLVQATGWCSCVLDCDDEGSVERVLLWMLFEFGEVTADTRSLEACGLFMSLFSTLVRPVCSTRRSMRLLSRGLGRGFEFCVKGTPVNGSLGRRPHVASLFWYSSKVLLSITIPPGKIIGKTMSSWVRGSRNSSGTGISAGTSSGLRGSEVGTADGGFICRLFRWTSWSFSTSEDEQQRAGTPQTARDLIPSAASDPLYGTLTRSWATESRDRGPRLQRSTRLTCAGARGGGSRYGARGLKFGWWKHTWTSSCKSHRATSLNCLTSPSEELKISSLREFFPWSKRQGHSSTSTRHNSVLTRKLRVTCSGGRRKYSNLKPLRRVSGSSDKRLVTS